MADFDAFELKPISVASIPQAIKKAEHYRLLNDPQQAESICLDILDVDPDNQATLVILILAVTDQFAADGPDVARTKEYLSRLTDEYQRDYYEGIIHERQARAFLGRGMSSAFAYDSLREAMDAYERAMRTRPEGEDESVLRWNACVRIGRRSHLQPRPREAEQPFE